MGLGEPLGPGQRLGGRQLAHDLPLDPALPTELVKDLLRGSVVAVVEEPELRQPAVQLIDDERLFVALGSLHRARPYRLGRTLLLPHLTGR